MKKAISYLRGQRVFTHALSKTTAGVWVLELPVLVADATDVEALGRQVTQALNASQNIVPHPTSWKGVFDPVLELASVKTWATFVKSARCVGIESVSDEVSFISTENLGASGGFKDIIRSACPVGMHGTFALGSGLLAAFDKANP